MLLKSGGGEGRGGEGRKLHTDIEGYIDPSRRT